ncbi:MAG TPA: protein kinase [Nocardioides sp.]|nr:protein kinase [Nocardioides sp.]
MTKNEDEPVLDGYEVMGLVRPDVAGGVLKARDPETGEVVALKRVPASAVDELHVAVMRLARLRHRHVSRILGFAEASGASYLVAEWVDGVTLDVLTASTPLSTAQALGVARGALLGLAHAHDRGLVHGNVSAATLVLDHEGEPLLTGFGLVGSRSSDVRGVAVVLSELVDRDLLPADLRGALLTAVSGGAYDDATEFLQVLSRAAEDAFGERWWTTAGIAELVAAAE